MTKLAVPRLFFGFLFALAAIGIGNATHLSARAATEYSQLVEPFVLATCGSSGPCLQETNSKSGPGIQGVSSKGHGTVGQTKFKSTSQGNGTAGVFGQDSSSSGVFDSGVLGTSTNGTGVRGTSVNGSGVTASSVNQSALFAQNTGSADGIQAVAAGNDGTNSSTQNKSSMFGVGRSGVWGHDDSTDGGRLNVGVAGSSTNGIGMSASSTGYVGANILGGGTVGQDFPALSVVGNSGGHALITACASGSANPCDSFDARFVVDGVGDVITHASIDADGNVDILGQYQVNGNCVAGCMRPHNGSPGRAVKRYVATSTVPSAEDYGEAQLVDGQAHVSLSSDFANVIDRHASYLVFITPEGDTNGVYVTQKTASGFVVRENHNGHSAVAFQYRIVAKPYGEVDSRLPIVQTGLVPSRARH